MNSTGSPTVQLSAGQLQKSTLIVFVPPGDEILLNYYARRFPAMAPCVAKMGLPASFCERLPTPTRIARMGEIDQLKLVVESTKYSEIDLVLAHEVDPRELVLDYPD